MATGGVDFSALQQQLVDLQLQLDQQRTAQAANAVNAVETLQLPPFWPLAPEDWFVVIEAMFTTRCITTEKTRYRHVLQKLLLETVTSLSNIICQVDTLASPYTHLMEKLTNTYGKSSVMSCLTCPPLAPRSPVS